jgi:hypothetical protein
VVVDVSENNIQVELIEQLASPTLQVVIPTTNLKNGANHVIQIRGVDPNGELVASDRGDFVLAQFNFTHNPPAEIIPEILIESVNVNYTDEQLIIALSTSDVTPFREFKSIILNSGNAQVGDVLTGSFPADKLIIMPIPAEIASTDGSEKFKARLEFSTNQGQTVVQEQEFTPPAAPQTSWWQTIVNALMAQPWILGVMVAILIAVVTGLLMRRVLETRHTPKPKPAPIDKSMVFDPRKDDWGYAGQSPKMPMPVFPAPAPATGNEFIDPLPSSTHYVRLTILNTPQPGNQPNADVHIQEFPCVIGREGGQANIKIMGDPRISREHLRLERQGSNITMMDLRSGNGTFLDGQKCEAERSIPLHGRQKVRLGPHTEILLEVG